MSKPNIVYALNCILIKLVSCKYYKENYTKQCIKTMRFVLKKTTSNITSAIKNVLTVL
mgnify:FL=1